MLKRRSWIVAAALVISLITVAPSAKAGTVCGDAYGFLALLPPASIGPISQTSGIGNSFSGSASLTHLGIPGFISADALDSSAMGTMGPPTTVLAVASVANLDLVIGMLHITADAVKATASLLGGVFSAAATFVNLLVNGMPVATGPNTMIPVPGVGTLILNEQLITGSTALNNAIDLLLDTGGQIIISHAFVSAELSPVPEPATWMMMLLGVVMVVFAVRMRGSLPASV